MPISLSYFEDVVPLALPEVLQTAIKSEVLFLKFQVY
jgi:hypothetical protein